jgi:NAD(P) transhydrogenase subunit alpha|tara:strand:+ start:203 stop:514 length:312 start_codon:yes stop_codon:yes gene_type:complete
MTLTLAALVASITVFVLAIFLGFELISKVPPTLHTPLMSGANAISGITIVGALILSNSEFNNGNPGIAAWLAFLALIMATINVVGGFMVTNRMLEMIAGKKRK